jgi:hypothetical protein
MDRTELHIKVPEAVRWEDEEKAVYDLESLRKAFNRHLYGTDEVPPDAVPRREATSPAR